MLFLKISAVLGLCSTILTLFKLTLPKEIAEDERR